MTAVDVDALDKLREAIGDDLAGWPIGSGYYSTEIGTDDAGELAHFLLAGSLAPLIAEVRRGRALREAVVGLAEDLDARWGDGFTDQAARRLRAVLAAVDGEQ